MSDISDAVDAFGAALLTRIGRHIKGPQYIEGSLIADHALFGTDDMPLDDIFTSNTRVLPGFSAGVAITAAEGSLMLDSSYIMLDSYILILA